MPNQSVVVLFYFFLYVFFPSLISMHRNRNTLRHQRRTVFYTLLVGEFGALSLSLRSGDYFTRLTSLVPPIVSLSAKLQHLYVSLQKKNFQLFNVKERGGSSPTVLGFRFHLDKWRGWGKVGHLTD